ncbi:MAG: hypothetical protein MZU84_03135 [Sphingobacterium sp.]|nr:hypothetical protein [Sphingobacterium sp.]
MGLRYGRLPRHAKERRDPRRPRARARQRLCRAHRPDPQHRPRRHGRGDLALRRGHRLRRLGRCAHPRRRWPRDPGRRPRTRPHRVLVHVTHPARAHARIGHARPYRGHAAAQPTGASDHEQTESGGQHP